MRFYLVILLFLSIPIISIGQNVEIHKDYLLINGKLINEKSKITDYINIIGEPTRIDTFKIINNYYFDQKGMEISTDSLNNVNYINFKLSKVQKWQSSLNKTFSGKISISELNFEVSKNTGYRDIKSTVKNSTKIDYLDYFEEKRFLNEPPFTKDNFESSDFNNEDKTTDFQYGIYQFNFDHNYFQNSTQVFTIGFIKPPKRIIRIDKSELNLDKIYFFVNSIYPNDTISFNLEESTKSVFFDKNYTNIFQDTLFTPNDIDFFKQQITLLDEFKWEQTKVNGAKVITNKRLKKIFKHYNGWKKFHKKHGKSLRKYAMPIFSLFSALQHPNNLCSQYRIIRFVLHPFLIKLIWNVLIVEGCMLSDTYYVLAQLIFL